LTLYLNETYYGNLAFGIEAASRAYFGKHAAELDLAECALLAGLPQSPARYNALENPSAAKERQRVVLQLMAKQGYITQEQARLAEAEKLSFASIPFTISAPHLVMYVRGELERQYGLEAIYKRGLQVYTTLDLRMQQAAERIVRYRLGQLARRGIGEPPRNVRNAALVALDSHTGEVLVMLGSPDYFDAYIDGAVNATVATRQPGSSIKPITYAAAFDPEFPDPLTPGSMVVDVRTAFITREGDPYVPQNYDREFHGQVLLRQALASSYNLVAVKVLDYVGLERMLALARTLGITTFDRSDQWGLALTLGGGEVRLLELTAAYGAFANGGLRVEPVTILRVEDAKGRTLYQHVPPSARRVLDERVAYLLTDILSDDFARMSAFGEGSPLRLTRPAAVKTGTSSDWRDNWTIGYTPQLVTGVWVGNADNEPMRHISGITGAAPIWHDFMEEVLRGKPILDFDEPPGLVRQEICADSGLLPSIMASKVTAPAGAATPISCPRTITELFIEGTEPKNYDNWHFRVRIDNRNGLLAGSACPEQHVVVRDYTLYPPEAQEWARQKGIPQPPATYSPLCPQENGLVARQDSATSPLDSPRSPGCSRQPESRLILSSPDQGAIYRIVKGMPLAYQKIKVALYAACDTQLKTVTMLVDGEPFAHLTAPPFEAFWTLSPGSHSFSATALDGSGSKLSSNDVSITVH
jgi:membrane peptidoglycan carboxypeptidase